MATPARQQYLDLKAQHPDALLWFRMGDFYELFDDDARLVARELHLTLTSREFGRGERVPMAGVPYHAADSYLARLVRKGYRVAVAEQVSPPGHGLVERVVTRVVSAGTVVEPGMLPAKANNYLAAVLRGPPGRGATPEAYGLAYVDVTTGEFAVTELAGTEAATALQGELGRLLPAETLVPWDQAGSLPLAGPVTRYDAWRFEPDAAAERLRREFGVRSLEGFGCADQPLAVGAAGALLAYLEDTNPAFLRLLSGPRTYSVDGYMLLDAHTRRNLELTHGARAGGAQGSLLAVLDGTRTAMGGRLLRRWLGQPLLDLAAIQSRQAAVAALVERPPLRAALLGLLTGLGDLERLTSRTLQGVASARDLLALGELLGVVEPLREALDEVPSLQTLRDGLDPCADVADLIARAVAVGEEGRLIRGGYDAVRDELVAAIADTRRWLAELESAERGRTGIRSLKVGYNGVFGYYIEVTNPHRTRVPADYVRKQTMANAERYITPQLKEAEARILHAEERIQAAERALFVALLGQIGEQAPRLLRTADALAHLDVYLALAEVADRHGYTRPEVHAGDEIAIEGGRHPVVEAALGPEAFIANDCTLDGDARIALLTGPNMAGKSTYLRQTALIVLLAQIGSFVPARRARLGLVDRVFTRIGAQDDLAAGASTFMVEMVETAAILRHATARSLVVLDEIGRGTSTQDGLAIARAVIEHLHDRVGARALFATHYHELIALDAHLPRLRNLHTAVQERDGEVVFLHRVAPGGADRSYGLHVARLAGLPSEVLARAAALVADGEAVHGNGHGPALVASEATLVTYVGGGSNGSGPTRNDSSGAPAARRDGLAEASGVYAPRGERAASRDGAAPLDAPGDAGPDDTARPLAPTTDDPHGGREPAVGLSAGDTAGSSGASAPAASAGPRDGVADAVLDALLALDLCHVTPLEALNHLAALQQRGRERRP